MRKSVVFIILIALLASCAGEVKWSNVSIENNDSLFNVKMSYPQFAGGKPAQKINKQIDQFLITRLAMTDSIANLATSVSGVIDTVLADKNRDSYLKSMPFDIMSEGHVADHKGLYSVYLKLYTYYGGAHGITTVAYLNFDKKSGNLLDFKDLFTDTVALRTINQDVFRFTLGFRNMEKDSSAFFVRSNELPLPKYIGFDSLGLIMQYNQYEIGPYYLGYPEYSVPYQAVNDLINEKYNYTTNP